MKHVRTSPYYPQAKGKVERPFDYVEKNLLNGRSFRTLEHLNEVTRWWLADVNDRRIHGTTRRTPLELHEQEQPRLIGLPTLRFDTAQVVYRIGRAAFPTEATLESYDWTRNPKTIRKEPFLELASGEFIQRKENAAFVGASGLGKRISFQVLAENAVLWDIVSGMRPARA